MQKHRNTDRNIVKKLKLRWLKIYLNRWNSHASSWSCVELRGTKGGSYISKFVSHGALTNYFILCFKCIEDSKEYIGNIWWQQQNNTILQVSTLLLFLLPQSASFFTPVNVSMNSADPFPHLVLFFTHPSILLSTHLYNQSFNLFICGSFFFYYYMCILKNLKSKRNVLFFKKIDGRYWIQIYSQLCHLSASCEQVRF